MQTIVFSALIGAGLGVLAVLAFAACCPGQDLGILLAIACGVAGANTGAMLGAVIRAVQSGERS